MCVTEGKSLTSRTGIQFENSSGSNRIVVRRWGDTSSKERSKERTLRVGASEKWEADTHLEILALPLHIITPARALPLPAASLSSWCPKPFPEKGPHPLPPPLRLPQSPPCLPSVEEPPVLTRASLPGSPPTPPPLQL